MSRGLVFIAAATLGMAAFAQAGVGVTGVFTENTSHTNPSSFIAGSVNAPYGWLAPVGDPSKVWEVYRKRVTGGAAPTPLNADTSLSNSGNTALIANEFFGNNGSQLTDLGMVFSVNKGTTSPALAIKSFDNQGMEFRVGFMQYSKVGTGWLNSHVGDNRIGNFTTGAAWGPSQDPGGDANGADTVFLKIKFTQNGSLSTDYTPGIYAHSGTDLANGEVGNASLLLGITSGTVGSGLQPVAWSITDAGNGTANFTFNWGGLSYAASGVSLSADSRSTAFSGTGGKLDLNDAVPFIFVGGAIWNTAGTGAAVAVPEPMSLGVIGLGALVILRRRRA